MENEQPIGSHAMFQVPAMEQKLEHVLLLLLLIDAPVEKRKDWGACSTCEDVFDKMNEELWTAQIRFLYSKRAGRVLRERYRMVQDGCIEDRVHGVVPCWTLIDSEANEDQGAPVLVVPTLTPRAIEAARALALLPIDPTPAFYRVPMYSREDRLRALAFCECWNIAAAHMCPSCCQRFPEGDMPSEEEPYLNRAQLLCSVCREGRKQHPLHH